MNNKILIKHLNANFLNNSHYNNWERPFWKPIHIHNGSQVPIKNLKIFHFSILFRVVCMDVRTPKIHIVFLVFIFLDVSACCICVWALLWIVDPCTETNFQNHSLNYMEHKPGLQKWRRQQQRKKTFKLKMFN